MRIPINVMTKHILRRAKYPGVVNETARHLSQECPGLSPPLRFSFIHDGMLVTVDLCCSKRFLIGRLWTMDFPNKHFEPVPLECTARTLQEPSLSNPQAIYYSSETKQMLQRQQSMYANIFYCWQNFIKPCSAKLKTTSAISRTSTKYWTGLSDMTFTTACTLETRSTLGDSGMSDKFRSLLAIKSKLWPPKELGKTGRQELYYRPTG